MNSAFFLFFKKKQVLLLFNSNRAFFSLYTFSKKEKLMNKKLMYNTQLWNEWFAGIVDGDGCLYIHKKEKSISFELTTHITDIRVVTNIKNMLKGGTVKKRSNSQSVRYRVKSKGTIFDILNRLNGKLYNPARVKQFQAACEMVGIEPNKRIFFHGKKIICLFSWTY
jgi:hypothetical protein